MTSETNDVEGDNVPPTEDMPTAEAVVGDVGAAAEAVTDSVAEAMAETGDELTRMKGERDDFYDKLLRTQAELENYRKRVRREREEDARYSSAGIVRELLPALDNLERAVKAAEETTEAGDLVTGVKMVAGQIEEILKRHHVEPIDAEGEAFDPNRHEALQQIPSPDVPAMTVLQQIERGYVLHDRVLRPAKVIVSSGPPAEPES